MTDPAVEWLLRSAEPAIRLRTLTELAGVSAGDARAVDTRHAVLDGPIVSGLLSGQQPGGGFGGHPYAKWSGAHWRLVSLMDLAVSADLEAACRPMRAALEPVFEWLLHPGHNSTMPTINGLIRRHASMEGNALGVAVHLGLAADLRAELLARALVDWQWPDGGWNCDRHPGARHSSFNESLPAFRGLAAFAHATGDRAAHDSANRAAELLLRHRVLFSERSGEPIHPSVMKLHWPPYWHYDLLAGLRALAEAGYAGDRRAADALDLLESKRRADGTWATEAAHFGKPGAKGSNVEVVDWGRVGQPSEPATLTALLILRAAGRA
ncbi:MAG TPA: hypothetical protein VFC71_05305 [Candidatus Polarisedimenticolia bacterium]|nr:hypothetical protein [Candidatus Polarisedimenticolia bacterium]